MSKFGGNVFSENVAISRSESEDVLLKIFTYHHGVENIELYSQNPMGGDMETSLDIWWVV